jgi:hypothetical protein
LRLVSVEDGGHLIFRAHFFLSSLNRDTALSVSVPLSEIRELWEIVPNGLKIFLDTNFEA